MVLAETSCLVCALTVTHVNLSYVQFYASDGYDDVNIIS